MPQSLANVLVHAVFGTYRRRPLIPRPLEVELHAYLGGVLRDNGCQPLRVGGVEDHVHLFFALSRTLTIAKTMETVKASSSRWMRDRGHPHFQWQGGYGIFSVNESGKERLIRYIETQREHHAKKPFDQELIVLLNEAGVKWDPVHLWS